jgi:hypothetical protein
MPFPIKTCILCHEEFELKPDKPGYANRCAECSTPEAAAERAAKSSAGEGSDRERDAARRDTIKNMLYPGK